MTRELRQNVFNYAAAYSHISHKHRCQEALYALEGPIGPPHLTNMNKITYRQAAIDSSVPCEFKKCN